MGFTREQAYQTVKEMRVAPVFAQSDEVKCLPENLDIFFGPPEEFFIASDSQEPYTGGRMVPILDDGNFGIVTFYDPRTGELAQYDIESSDEVHATFRCWQQYLAALLFRVVESIGDGERIRRIAALVRFHYVEDLFAVCHRAAGMSYQQFREERQRFIQSVVEVEP